MRAGVAGIVAGLRRAARGFIAEHRPASEGSVTFLRLELLTLRAQLMSREPPAGWKVVETWAATDGSMRSICYNYGSGLWGHGDGKGGWWSDVSSTPFGACEASDEHHRATTT